MTRLLKPFVIDTKTFLGGNLKHATYRNSISWGRLNSRSQFLIVRDMESELRGCFRMLPRTQRPHVATLGLESGAL